MLPKSVDELQEIILQVNEICQLDPPTVAAPIHSPLPYCEELFTTNANR